MHVSPKPVSRILWPGAIVLVGATQARAALAAGPASIVLSCALALTLALALLPWRFAGRSMADTPFPLISLGAATIITVVLHEMTPNGASALALLGCVIIATIRMTDPKSLAIAVTAIAAPLVTGAIAGDVSKNLPLVLSTTLAFLVAYASRQRIAARQAEAREAVLAERARIARELHDILAHSLSAQLVHLEGAKLLLRAERTDEAFDRVASARDLARSGLEEARRAVAALRENPPEPPTALRRLKEEFESSTQLPCTLRISGPERRLPPEAELALTRTTQEALTNIRRHAPGNPATIDLTFSADWCELRITNPTDPRHDHEQAIAPREGDSPDHAARRHHSPNGTSPQLRSQTVGLSGSRSTDDSSTAHGALGESVAEQRSLGGGHGLVGMRERAELLGGTLTAGADDHSYTVHLRIPA